MVTNVAYELQTSNALIIGFDTPAAIQTSREPLENLVATRAAQHSITGAWDSAAFSNIFLASGFPCSQALSTPAPAPRLADANRWAADSIEHLVQ